MTDNQKKALETLLTLHNEGKVGNDECLTIITALFESTPQIQYVPYFQPDQPATPYWMYYGNNKNTGGQIFEKKGI